MEFKQGQSGIVVPEKPPEPPLRQLDLLEIVGGAQREIAKEAMLSLWDAMDLSRGGGGVRLLGDDRREEHRRLYRFVGETLLGGDCPEKEVLT